MIATVLFTLIISRTALAMNDLGPQNTGSCQASPVVDEFLEFMDPVLENCSDSDSVDDFVDCASSTLGIDPGVYGRQMMKEISSFFVHAMVQSVDTHSKDVQEKDDPIGVDEKPFKCPCMKDQMLKDEL